MNIEKEYVVEFIKENLIKKVNKDIDKFISEGEDGKYILDLKIYDEVCYDEIHRYIIGKRTERVGENNLEDYVIDITFEDLKEIFISNGFDFNKNCLPKWSGTRKHGLSQLKYDNWMSYKRNK